MNSPVQPFNPADFQKPEDLLNLIKHERLRWLIATIALDGAKMPEDPRPEWAIRAATEFWKCSQDLPKTKQAQCENYSLGFMFGVISRLPMPKSMELEPALLAVASLENLTPLLHAEFAKGPASDAVEFYAGFAEGLKRGQLSPRSPYVVYLCFAAAWPELSELKNLTQVHAWLETHLGPNMTGTRDRITKVCQKIRFPLKDKGGRPARKPRKAPES